ncbi:MAG TPA: hypothetical protein VFA85_12725 [Terriglobales bacterium]|nr:hypothetical protein [Terriglobales bacterium]
MSRVVISPPLIAAFIIAFVFSLSAPLHAQTPASCTFTYFNPPPPDADYGFSPNSINDNNTVVGEADGSNNYFRGFIRKSGGAITQFKVPKSYQTTLRRINVHGTAVGGYGNTSSTNPPPSVGFHGLIYTSSAYATLNYPGSNSTVLTGINHFNTIVGTANDPKNSGGTLGFKYLNGQFTAIRYPGAVQTTANAINDNGVIVGGYKKSSAPNTWFGYIRQKDGTFKGLNYYPNDINSNGTIVENNNIHFPDGTVKSVWVNGSVETALGGINNLGALTGFAYWGTFEYKGFIAKCH